MIASVSIAALDNFFSTIFSCFIISERFGDVLNDHFFEIHTKLIPRLEYSFCNFNKIFSTLVFFEILFSIVSISSGSAAAKTIEKKLSRAAIETLAIIVYHQPVTRAEIEEIRGVVFGTNTLEILMELNWVKPGGRKDVPGKPIQYVTTDDFLSHFNLQKLSDLPTVDELGAAGLIDSTNIDNAIFGTGKFYKEKEDGKKEDIYSNIDEMLSSTLDPEEKNKNS